MDSVSQTGYSSFDKQPYNEFRFRSSYLEVLQKLAAKLSKGVYPKMKFNFLSLILD